MGEKDNNAIEKKVKGEKENIFSRIGGKIEEFRSALRYNFPDAEKIVKLKGGKEKQAMEREKTFIDENNFRLQIGKMQDDGNTIYSPMMLSFGLEYIANHMKLDENGNGKAIIQLWPDLAQALAQDDKQILTFDEEKKKIEALIKEILGKKGKCIEIQNVAYNYPDVFNAIKKGKNGIIPSKEPNLSEFDAPLKSPLPIIEFLAYHCQQDKELMQLFYNTKPDKYIGQDQRKGCKPGESNADYYSVVEVGIRLFEILNGITIQGGIGRQRVYDKIISLILFGKDRIGKYESYKTLPPLTTGEYKALEKLHNWIIQNYENTAMQQLYIELDEKSLSKLEGHKRKKEKAKSKLKKAGIITAMIASLGTAGGVVGNDIVETRRERQREEEREREIMENMEQWSQYRKNTGERLEPLPMIEREGRFKDEQSSILLSEYDLSAYDYDLGFGVIDNKITNEYRYAFDALYRLEGRRLTAEEFMDAFWGGLNKEYHLPHKKPYQHFKDEEGTTIENTLTYGNDIDISKCKIEEIKTEKQYSYYIKGYKHDKTHGNYILKIFRVYIDDGKSIDLIFAAKTNINGNPIEDFNLESGMRCMIDLLTNYGDGLSLTIINGEIMPILRPGDIQSDQ